MCTPSKWNKLAVLKLYLHPCIQEASVGTICFALLGQQLHDNHGGGDGAHQRAIHGLSTGPSDLTISIFCEIKRAMRTSLHERQAQTDFLKFPTARFPSTSLCGSRGSTNMQHSFISATMVSRGKVILKLRARLFEAEVPFIHWK